MNHRITYPLLPFSQLVYDMSRLMPGVYTFPFALCWHGGAPYKQQAEEAVRQTIANHPAFKMKIDWQGRHYPGTLKDDLHGKYHHFCLYTKGEDLFIHASISRILGDGKSGEIFVEDFARALNRQPLEHDDYWGYLEHIEQVKQSPHFHESQSWLQQQFADTTIPVRPTIDRPWLGTILPPKPGLYTSDYSDLQQKITNLSSGLHLSADGFFSLCTALAIAEYCGTNAAALTWAYEGRELPEEQRIFGSLHRDVPFAINVNGQMGEWRKDELIRLARNQIRSGIAHSDYPYTLTAPYSNRWNYAVNVLYIYDIEDIIHNTSLPFDTLPQPAPKVAYALLDVEIHQKPERLQICYRYSATHYKPESIRRFAALVRKYAEWLLE